MRVARPLLRFGRPACIYEHLCPEEWSPVQAFTVCMVLKTTDSDNRPMGTGSDFNNQRRLETDLRLIGIAAGIGNHTGRANEIIGVLVYVAMNP